MNKTLLLTALVSASAFAQETPPPPPPQPAADQPVMAANPTIMPTEMVSDPGGRVRWGVSGNLGWHLPYSAFTIGAEGRIGYQVSNLFGAYAILGVTGGFGFGGTATTTGGSVSVTGLSRWYVGGIAEIMLGDLFYVGAGPVLANGAMGIVGLSAGTTGGGISAVVDGGLMPGLDIRLGLGLGRPKGPPSFRRGGFNLGVNVLMLLHPDTTVTRVQGDVNGGSISVDTKELVFTATPMLMLGYDAR